MDERPVTASCEQCGRLYQLRIAAPGSGDLHLRRMQRLFGWCAGCGMFVARACCWDPAAVACARCAAASLRADARAPVPVDPHPARAAIRQLDAAIAALAEHDDSIEPGTQPDGEHALDAWEDAWLASASLIARVESCRLAAARRLQDLSPSAVEPARELQTALRSLLATYETRGRSTARRLVSAGRHIAERSATSGPPQPARAPTPSVATTVATTAGVVAVPADPPASAAMPASAQAPGGRPTEAEAVAALEPTPAAIVPGRRRAGRRWFVLVAALLVIVGALLAVGVASSALRALGAPPASAAAGEPARASGDVRATGAATAASSPSEGQPPVSTLGAVGFTQVVAFDRRPIGRLEADGAVVTRVMGVAEIAPFPSPFDRSLRLEGVEAGLCVGVSGHGAAPALVGFDLHITAPGPMNGVLRISVAPVAMPPVAFEFALAGLAALPAEEWYRITLSWDGAGSAELEVGQPGSSLPILDVTLAEDEAAPDGEGHVCLRIARGPPGMPLFVDSLRIDR